MKRFLFISFVCLLLLTIILPACAGGAAQRTSIKFGIIGPMENVQGQHQWWGAQLKANDINAAGGISLGGKKYPVELVKSDSNEILSVNDATTAMERLITVDKVDFVLGGFRTEAVSPMQDIAMGYKKIFIDDGAATPSLCQKVNDNYDKYKYFFRGTPFNDVYLVTNMFEMVKQVAYEMKKQLGITGQLRIAIIAEKAEWAEPIVVMAKSHLKLMGFNVVGVWRPSDTATDVSAEMTAMAAQDPQIIFVVFSGPVGITFAKRLAEIQMPAMPVGIIVENKFIEATGPAGLYTIISNSYTNEVQFNETTQPFVQAFIKESGEVPIYTSATFDGIGELKQCIEQTQSLDPDVIVKAIEETKYHSVAGTVAYYPLGQEAPNYAHDLVYGPGYLTGIATQYQTTDPITGSRCVWPQPYDGEPADFKDVQYPGTYPVLMPPTLIQKYKGTAPATTP